MEIIEYIDNFILQCSSLGIKRGDVVYISSDVTQFTYNAVKQCGIRGLLGRNDFYSKLIDAFQELVGNEGTLLFPMFTWSFCKGIPYNTTTTPGEVGALNNWILKNRDDFKRTAHPLYSFMVWGRDAEMLCAMTNRTAWGADSPFEYFHRIGAKNLLLNVSLEQCFTFTHYVEESIGIPCRYYKDFRGEYITEDGISEERTYTMFVRDLDIESAQVTPDNCLINAGVAKKTVYNGMTLQCVELNSAYPHIVENYKFHNGDEWYDFYGYQIDWNGPQTHPNETTMNI